MDRDLNDPVRRVRSVCPYCGVGCGMLLHVQRERVIKISGDSDHPANFGRLCTKGLSAHTALHDSGRLAHAYVRPERGRGSSAEPVRTPIAEAIEQTAHRLRQTLEQHGPEAIALYVSGQMSIEAQYLANKLAKGFIRTPHIESNSRLCMASAASGYKLSLGADGPPGSYEDFDRADLFFVIGANMADCHPILFLRMMERVKAGAKLIVVDPRRTATADKADLFLQIRPGTDLALLNGLLHLLFRNGHTDSAFIREHTQGWDTMPAFLDDYLPARVSALTGIPEADIRRAADWIGHAPEWTSCWTMGLNQSTHGTWSTNAICNLHLATGKICRPGSGPFSLTGQPNAMGGREMGYMGPGLPGQRSVAVEEDRAFVEALWQLPGGTLKATSGSGTVDLFSQMAAGKIKACWIICTNPVASVANRQTVIAGLQAADCVIVQDAFIDTETNRYADILLPGALWAEADGVMVNSERNMTLAPRAVPPPGDAMADWQIIAAVASAMGYADAFDYASAEAVFAEITDASNPRTGYELRGASHARLRKTPLQWPCDPGSSEDRHPIRYLHPQADEAHPVACHESLLVGASADADSNADADDADGASPGGAVDSVSDPAERGRRVRMVPRFPTPDGRAVFFARPHIAPAEMPDTSFPMVFNTGRLQHQWHTLTKTGKIPMLNKLNPSPFIEIHPEDADALGIRRQDRVAVRSRRGQVVLPAVLTDRVQPGSCFSAMHWNDVYGDELCVNGLTNDAVDLISLQPEFKFCAVTLEKVSSASTEAAGDLRHGGLPAASDRVDTFLRDALMNVPIIDTKTNNGLADADAGANADAAAPPGCIVRPRPKVMLLWASQTGHVESLIEDYAAKLVASGCDLRSGCMADHASHLSDIFSRMDYVLFVTSTFGDGDAPDNAQAFWSALAAATPSRLDGLPYSVLALGDSNYEQFCGFGVKLDAKMRELGAVPFVARQDCDADFEEDAHAWLTRVAAYFGESIPAAAGDAAASPDSAASPASEATSAIASDAAPIQSRAPRTAMPSGHDVGSKHHPIRTRLLENRPLNQFGSGKETRHLALSIAGTPLAYDVGDALGVWPVNCPELVAEILSCCGIDAAEQVELSGRGAMRVDHALAHHVEIARPTTQLLAYVASHATSGHHHHGGNDGNDAMPLQTLLETEHKEALKQWLWGRQVADVLHAYPLTCSASALIQLLKPLQPRLYSIASSPIAHPGEVHLTISTVRYGCGARLRKGVSSAFLADRAQASGLAVFVQKSGHFRLPLDGDAPIIMIGPGTGVAPFRAFLHDRQARGNTGANWLFFGEQHAATDYYYQNEFESMLARGLLTRLDLAFSRDQAEKIYVQDRMRERGAALWDWIASGAYIYVCGDAGRMAKDVDAALKEIIALHGDMSAEDAHAYVSAMSGDKRYLRDVY